MFEWEDRKSNYPGSRSSRMDQAQHIIDYPPAV